MSDAYEINYESYFGSKEVEIIEGQEALSKFISTITLMDGKIISVKTLDVDLRAIKGDHQAP